MAGPGGCKLSPSPQTQSPADNYTGQLKLGRPTAIYGQPSVAKLSTGRGKEDGDFNSSADQSSHPSSLWGRGGIIRHGSPGGSSSPGNCNLAPDGKEHKLRCKYPYFIAFNDSLILFARETQKVHLE